MSDEELQALAAKGKAARAERAERKADEAKAKPKSKPKPRQLDPVLKRSLSGTSPRRIVLFTTLVALVPAILAGFFAEQHPDLLYIGGGLAVAAFVGGFVAIRVLAQRHVEAELAWLEGLRWDFDRAAYLQQLSRSEREMGVRVRVEFVAPPAEDRRQLLADAVLGVCPDAKTSWKKGALLISSPKLKTRFTSRSTETGSTTTHNNQAVHAWFRRCVDEAVARIDSSEPVRALATETH